MNDMQEFRDDLLSRLVSSIPDFGEYVASESYLNDLPAIEAYTDDFLINIGIDFLVNSFLELGIIVNEYITKNYYDVDLLLNIYDRIQIKGILELYNQLPNDLQKHFIEYIHNVNENEDMLHELYNWLVEYLSNESYSEEYKIIVDYLVSNKTFKIYLFKVIDRFLKEPKDKDLNLDSDTDIQSLKVWNIVTRQISTAINQIEKYEDFNFKPQVIHTLHIWLTKLCNNDFLELCMWYVNRHNISDEDITVVNRKLELLKNEYKTFRLHTEGYKEYYDNLNEDEKIYNPLYIELVCKYVGKLDPLKKLLSEGNEI